MRSFSTHDLSGFSLTNIRSIKHKSLKAEDLSEWPKRTMPFYVYGNQSEKELHIDHALLAQYPA